MAERQRAEEALRQAQKMEAVGQLTGGIAHDFNNLLTPIIGGLEIIAPDRGCRGSSGSAQAALESGRARRQARPPNCSLSPASSGISMAPIDVNRVIAEHGGLLRHTIGRGIEIVTALDPRRGHALCDANQLENAILNLAINARDAMPDGGTLTISTSLRQEPTARICAPAPMS